MALSAASALVGGDDLPLGVLHLGGGVDQRRVEPRPVGAKRLDFGLDAPTLLVGGAQRVFDPAQALLLGRLVVGGRGGSRRGARADRHARAAAPAGVPASASAPSAACAAKTIARTLWAIAACLNQSR